LRGSDAKSGCFFYQNASMLLHQPGDAVHQYYSDFYDEQKKINE
jgi:hypothetical protein